MNTTINGMTAAQVEKIASNVWQSLKNSRPVWETDRNCFAFALYIGRELSRFLTVGAWYTQEQAERVADGMALAALSFKKTASIAVYILQDNGVYKLFTTRQNHGFALNYIHKSRISGRDYLTPTKEEDSLIYSRGYIGASALPVGWNEPKQITVGDTVTHKKTTEGESNKQARPISGGVWRFLLAVWSGLRQKRYFRRCRNERRRVPGGCHRKGVNTRKTPRYPSRTAGRKKKN